MSTQKPLAVHRKKTNIERRVALGIRFITHQRKLRKMSLLWAQNFLVFGRTYGHVFINTNVAYNNECPLALAFSDIPSFVGEDGYVTEASVLRHINISPQRLEAMGFDSNDGDEMKALNAEWGRQIWDRIPDEQWFPRRHFSSPVPLSQILASKRAHARPSWWRRVQLIFA